jgi:hypothetical protein
MTPGTVLAVKAYKQFTGERRLVDVPADLYRVETKTYGAITAVQLVFNRPLSSIQDQGWSDDVYVTFESTIGPNIIDILKYLIQDYLRPDQRHQRLGRNRCLHRSHPPRVDRGCGVGPDDHECLSRGVQHQRVRQRAWPVSGRRRIGPHHEE